TANLGGNPDVIEFNIPGSGTQTITPSTALPDITDPVIIDGYSQPGAAPNTLAAGDNAALVIQIDGSAAGAGTTGLVLNASNSTVQGLAITGFQANPSGGGNGIVVSSSGNVIAGNFIGLLPDGTTAAGNGGDGVFINFTSGNLVGGTTPAARNLISGNAGNGVEVRFGASNIIQGNYIGTDSTGTAARGNGPVSFGSGISILR